MKPIQIHLSTLIVLSIVTGYLIWANTQARDVYDLYSDSYYVVRGWPIPSDFVFSKPKPQQLQEDGFPDERGNPYVIGICDGVAGLMIVFFTYAVCEWRIRRQDCSK